MLQTNIEARTYVYLYAYIYNYIYIYIYIARTCVYCMKIVCIACRPLRHGVLKDFPKGHLKVLEQRYGAVNPCFKGLEFGNGDGMESPKIT